MLPGMDGLEVLAQIRREANPYVILLTARSEEVDKIVGLSVGADDYVTKPFSMRELTARVKAALRRQLIGDVSHELRTPLAAIKGSLEALIDGLLPAEPETFEQIYQEADRLQRLVNDLQELSRVESGGFGLNLRRLLIADLLKTSAMRLERQYAEKGVRLEAEIPSDLPEVQADADRLSQVLFNLLGNALQYTPAGGQVTVAAHQQGHEVVVSVQDTGIGIAAEHLPNVFDRFYRVDRSRARVSGGSGIGLTIAKHLVEAQGGRIWAESPGQGEGATFTFTLPIAA
jgi:histidine kinase